MCCIIKVVCVFVCLTYRQPALIEVSGVSNVIDLTRLAGQGTLPMAATYGFHWRLVDFCH